MFDDLPYHLRYETKCPLCMMVNGNIWLPMRDNNKYDYRLIGRGQDAPIK